jgi:hypothetical protein
VGADLSTSCGVSPRWGLCSTHGVLTGVPTWVDRAPLSSNKASVRAAWMATRWALQRSLAHTAAWLVWCGTIVYSRVLTGYSRNTASLEHCAGAYVSGAAGSNECPAGSVRIETEDACRTAVAAAGKTPGSSPHPFVETNHNNPRGCYYNSGRNTAYFNAHAVGAGEASSRLLCAAVTGPTGAPPSRRCARACTA